MSNFENIFYLEPTKIRYIFEKFVDREKNNCV